MNARKTHVGLGLFFVSVGSVCSGPALGQSEATPVTPDASGAPTSLIAESTPTPETAAAPAQAAEPLEVFSSDQPLPQGQNVKVGDYGQIDLHVKDLDLTRVLQLLSIQSEKNIIASRNVAGTVSADLYGVDFYDALDAILHPNGFGYEEAGQFIYVYTQNELEQRREAERQTVHKVVRLSYVSGADAATFVTPLLSKAGSVAVSADPEQGFQPSISNGGANSFAHTDTLLINDYAENVDAIVNVLKEIDVRPKQVLIESTVLQTRLTEDNAFGVDFAVFADLDLLDFTTPLGAFNQLQGNAGPWDSGGTAVSNPGNTATGDATLKFGVLSDDVAVFVRALDRVADTNVIARPSMLVLNRQRADLLIGERLGYISTNASETSTTQTVEFLDVGTNLTVRPFIGEDDYVRLELRPSVSDGATTLVGGFVIPNTSTAELVTNVMIKSGHTAVLGGLFKEDTGITRQQVPGLGSIPIAGIPFRGQDDTLTRSEVIFMIKPTVMKDNALYEIGEAARDGVELSRVGIREGLLPWSRTKLVNWQMSKAHEAYEAGDLDKAKWHADVALHLDPTAAEARQIREKAGASPTYHHDFSILSDVVDAALKKQGVEPAAKATDTPPAPTPNSAPAEAASTADATDAPTGAAAPVAAEFEFFPGATVEPADDDAADVFDVVEAWSPSASQMSEVETNK